MTNKKKNPVKLIDAIEMLKDGTSTIIMPLFLVTDINEFSETVLRYCESALKDNKKKRIYIIMQQGFSEKKARKIWQGISNQGQYLNQFENSDCLEVYSFSNVPIDIMSDILDGVTDAGASVVIEGKTK